MKPTGLHVSMLEDDYYSRGAMAWYWDLLHGDTSGWSSRPYFLELIRDSGEPVLDVACGTGRLLLDYNSIGIEINGVDSSRDMLEICSQKAIQLDVIPVSTINRCRRWSCLTAIKPSLCLPPPSFT